MLAYSQTNVGMTWLLELLAVAAIDVRHRTDSRWHDMAAEVTSYFKSINGTELPSIYWGSLPSHFCTAS